MLGGLAAVLLCVGWSAFTIWQVAQDLHDARDAGIALGRAASVDDRKALQEQAERLEDSARSASDASGSWWWAGLTHLPVVGDDLGAVRSLSSSLDTAASGAVVPLVSQLVGIEGISRSGALDTKLMSSLGPDVATAAEALTRASSEVDDLRPDAYFGPIGDGTDEWMRAISDASTAARDAAATLEVLPAMVGADGPQRILLVFETNAEIRATGGLPGYWTLIEADQGRLRVLRQGSGGAVDRAVPDALVTSSTEQSIWGPQLGLYFRDANMTSDFPRAAELMRDRWVRAVGTPLDGIISVDVVTLGYLLDGLGPVEVAGQRLDGDNAVPGLLNAVYEDYPVDEQNEVFAQVARLVVAKLTGEKPDSVVSLLAGVARGTVEDRIHAAWFDDEVSKGLEGTRLEGAFETDASETPVVDITLNDATGSKMSYFLRYDADVKATDCAAGQQRLEGSLRLLQTVPAARAATFDPYVTGGGAYGVPPGEQVVLTRIFGPVDGTITALTVNGRSLDPTLADIVTYRGRPVITLALQPDSKKGSEVSWAMVTGQGQAGSPLLRVTPGVQKGTQSGLQPSAC